MWIERPPEIFRALFPGALFREAPSGLTPGKVYLTFDDGPIPEVTPWVLDILDKFGIKATFFMVGENVIRHPELLEQIKLKGHAIGNHTKHHVKGRGLSTSDYLIDAQEGERITGSSLFRPPHGFLTGKQFKSLKTRYKIVMYDLVSRDYSSHLTSDQVVKIVKKYVRDGSIIVFHDSIKSMPRLKKALPEALEWLLKKGYVFDIIT